jgi:hypothetical protein
MNRWLVRFLLGCVAAMFATSAALAQTKTQRLAIVGRERGLSPLSSTTKDELEKNGVKIDDGLLPDEFDAPLLAAHDTVVFSQICSIGKDLSPEMKQALLKWMAEGHKFILHNADNCWVEKKPDYSFLPFSFETDSPGGHAAPGDELFFVENNTLGTSDPRDKTHFVDLAKWVEGNEGNNELGDSNIVTTQSKDWCGHMFGTNVQGPAASATCTPITARAWSSTMASTSTRAAVLLPTIKSFVWSSRSLSTPISCPARCAWPLVS